MDDKEEFLLSFNELPELGLWTDLVERVCKMLPISNVQCLSISSRDIVDSINWVDLFKRCTKVTAMQAIGRGTTSLVRALTTKLTNMRPGGPRSGKGRKMRGNNRDGTPAQPARSTAPHAQAPIFPKLTSLSLMEMDFSEKEHPSGILFDVVEKGLRQRRSAYRAPLKTLEIEKCAISARRAKALEKLVQGFHWDGEEVIRDEFEDFDDDDPEFVGPVGAWEDLSFSTTLEGALDWAAEPEDGW
jgi:hypothetical protein